MRLATKRLLLFKTALGSEKDDKGGAIMHERRIEMRHEENGKLQDGEVSFKAARLSELRVCGVCEDFSSFLPELRTIKLSRKKCSCRAATMPRLVVLYKAYLFSGGTNEKRGIATAAVKSPFIIWIRC
eukprot:g80349.t1